MSTWSRTSRLPFSKHGSRLSTRSLRNRLGWSSGWTAWKGKCTSLLVYLSPSSAASELTTASNSCQRGGNSLLLLQQALSTRDLHLPPPSLNSQWTRTIPTRGSQPRQSTLGRPLQMSRIWGRLPCSVPSRLPSLSPSLPPPPSLLTPHIHPQSR